jgi:hypothetical protein
MDWLWLEPYPEPNPHFVPFFDQTRAKYASKTLQINDMKKVKIWTEIYRNTYFLMASKNFNKK